MLDFRMAGPVFGEQVSNRIAAAGFLHNCL
jgi:hypothetical protein